MTTQQFDDWTPPTPTNTWVCGDCGETCERYRGQGDVTCECGARYNAGGQRLRDDAPVFHGDGSVSGGEGGLWSGTPFDDDDWQPYDY